ncbi:19337_t:CDS:2 [Entrophospora sp. SA101]|nr:19337_t:CDS:2 [Entrophospora sp. SA101]
MSICQVTLVSFLLHQKECYLDEDCPLISEGQLCIHGVCAFECLGNSDCPQEGKCDSNLYSNSVSIGSTNDANPLTIPIILGVIIILFTIGILFLLIYLLKKRKVKNKSKLPKIKRSKLSTSSVAPEMRSTSKNNNNGAVGYSASENLGDKSFSHIQSQTVYGNSASATSMIELQTASHLPVLQEHHFMSQDGYISPQP